MSIEPKKYPFFESFMRYFLLNEVEKDKEKIAKSKKSIQFRWVQEFQNSWRETPEWWQNGHDIVLIELALRYNVDHGHYIEELIGPKASDYMMRLRSKQSKIGTYIHGHSFHFSESDSNLKLITDVNEE
eukprot:399577_1